MIQYRDQYEVTMSSKSKGYVSEIDQFLQSYDQQHPELSAAQQKEKVKYERIYRLRDKATRTKESSPFDEWF